MFRVDLKCMHSIINYLEHVWLILLDFFPLSDSTSRTVWPNKSNQVEFSCEFINDILRILMKYLCLVVF